MYSGPAPIRWPGRGSLPNNTPAGFGGRRPSIGSSAIGAGAGAEYCDCCWCETTGLAALGRGGIGGGGGAGCRAGGGGAAGRAVLAEQLGQSLYDGGTSAPHFGQIQLNISLLYHTSMTLFRQGRRANRRLGVLAGSFNPVTRAHLALASSALDTVEEVLLVLPRQLPHKDFRDSSLEARMEILEAALAGHSRFSAGVSDGGLFREIAEECHRAYGEELEVNFICGRDAAERIVGWDYRGGPGIADQMKSFSLLVAARKGQFQPPPELADRIRTLPLEDEFDSHSATIVRDAIARGESWESLVPPSAIPLIRKYYVQS